jgi:hypothetical protein
VGQVITHFTLTDDSPCEGLRLTLKPVPRGTLTGFVFQSDGTTPAAGVQVLPLTSEKRTELNWYAVGPYGTSSDWQMETAKDGSYCLSNLPAGTYTLCFSPWPLPRGRWDLPVEGRRPGGPTVRVNVSVEAGKETGLPPVALPPGGALTGTVRTRGGRPVVGALLRVYGTPADLPLGLRAGPVRTDAQGRYRLDGLAAGRYFVIVTAPGYRDARSREQGQVQVREGTTTYDVELQTMPGAAE